MSLEPGRGNRLGGEEMDSLVVSDTVRSHPRPGSNSDGSIVLAETLRARTGREGGGIDVDNVIAAPLTKGSSSSKANEPGRRKEDDENLVVIGFHPTAGGSKGLSPEEGITPGTGTGNAGAIAVAFTANQRDELRDLGDKASSLDSAGGTHQTTYLAHEGVRRLTPRECERLQGFPDDWTQLGKTKDAPRYSALGDAVTVDVAEWIGSRFPSD